jgi:hypothetical protein
VNEYTDVNGKSYLSEVKTDMISKDDKIGDNTINSVQNSMDNSMIKIIPPAGQVDVIPIQDINFNLARHKNINEAIL